MRTGSLQGDNDGVVPLETARWGQFSAVVEADHLGLIWGQSELDLRGFYTEIGRDLIRMEQRRVEE